MLAILILGLSLVQTAFLFFAQPDSNYIDSAVNRGVHEITRATARQNDELRRDITTVLLPVDSNDVRKLRWELLRMRRLIEADTASPNSAFNLKDRARH